PALEGAHDVDDALVDVEQLGVIEGAGVGAADVIEDLLLALGLVDGEGGGALELSDGSGRLCALVDEADDLLIELVDFLTPVADLHSLTSLQVPFGGFAA